MQIINAGICLDDIDESRLYTHENGKKWLNVTFYVKDQKNQKGQDVDIIQQMTKEEIDAKKAGDKIEIIRLGTGRKAFDSTNK